MFRRRLIWNGAPKAPIVDGVPLVANVSDIAYKASNGKIMVVSPDAWSSALGIPVGVVVIPSGFAPDGKARIVSLSYVCNTDGSVGDATKFYWSKKTESTSLTDYTQVPITDNTDSTATGSNHEGYLPSDAVMGTLSYVDKFASYAQDSNMIPSPYLGDKPNPAYCKVISGYNNALSDFDGLGNTKVLADLYTYSAAYSARNYQVTGVEWYLPAIGEFGVALSRMHVINNALSKVGGAPFYSDYSFWSSTEYTSNHAWYINTSEIKVSHNTKAGYSYVRPFAQLDF